MPALTAIEPSLNRSGTATRTPWVIAFLATAAAVFYLPYFFPLQPTNSYSYVFGYNNRVAVLLVVALGSVTAFLSRGALLRVRQPVRDGSRIPRSHLIWAAVMTLLLCLTMIALVGALGGYQESGYDIYRLYLVSLGRHPYRDFEWPFGIALLYIPLWTARLFHLSLLSAFSTVLTVASVLSTWALYAVINRLRFIGGKARTWIFWLLFLLSLGAPLNFGLHYVGLRYLLPMLVLLWAADLSRIGPMAAAVLLPAAAAVMLVTSPEMAIAVLVAGAVVLMPRNAFTRSRLSWPAYFFSVVSMAALVLLAGRLGVFDTARASGGGADSLPFVPSAPAILFLLNVFLGLSVLVWRWRHPNPEDNTPVLILTSIPLLPAALGRADPGHLYSNGLGFAIAVLVYLWPRRVRYVWAVVYLLPFLLSFPVALATDFGFTAMLAVSRDSQPGHTAGLTTRASYWAVAHLPNGSFRRKQAQRLEDVRTYPVGDTYDFAQLFPSVPVDWSHTVLAAPYGFNPTHSNAMVRSPLLDLGFYQGDENANTPAAVQRKIAELSAHPDRPVLMPDHAENGAPHIDAAAERHQLTGICQFPYRARARHTENIYGPLYDYVLAHYRLAAEPSLANHLYEIWLPR